VVGVLAGSAVAINMHHQRHYEALVKEIKTYIDNAYRIERQYIETTPIYRDFTSAAKESKLRRHLIAAHRKRIHEIAERYGIDPFHTSEDIVKAFKDKKLVSIDLDKPKLYYFHNVRKQYRYVTPLTKKGLETLTRRFQANLQKRKKGVRPVKLAISSVIRPVDYQKKLFNRAFVSTHSYGTTFDIFFEDFMVDLPEKTKLGKRDPEIEKKIRRRLMLLMGDALRRQFHAVLMETLMQLQDEGLLYAILEKNNRCYHVTILR